MAVAERELTNRQGAPGPPEGRIRWKRTACMLVPGVLCVGAVAVALAQGAVAASFAVSGKNVKASVKELSGSGITAFPASTSGKGGKAHPVMLATVRQGQAKGVCASMVQKVPVLGDVSIVVRAAESRPAEANNVIVNADALLDGEGEVSGAQVGRDASTLTGIPGSAGPQGLFGIQADKAVAKNIKGTAWAANGGSLKASGLKVEMRQDGKQCY
ncbi:DUF6230 family protein [Streptomyces sp. ODS28]|uniref:DUF6230 family protein n=1 Tax=Streptomyces sp. ODS28 TaxID=3136688 RepID=UPI0031EC5486